MPTNFPGTGSNIITRAFTQLWVLEEADTQMHSREDREGSEV
jgi:hypothetical protein